MILEQLGISEEKFEEYLEELINETSVDEALRMSGLLPSFTSSIQVEPKITSSSKSGFLRDDYKGNKQLKIQDATVNRNYNMNSFKIKKVERVDLEDNLLNYQDRSLAA